MRLLVVTQYFWPENFRINDLVSELVKRGHQITVLTGQPNYPDGKIFPEFLTNRKAFSSYHGAEVIRVPMISRGKGGLRLIMNYFSFALNATLFGLWELRHRKFDAIFSFEPSPITVALPAIALRAQKKIPFTFWVLDLWPETLQAIGVVRSKKLLNIVGKLVSFIYKRCDLILAQSKSFIPQIKHYAGSPSRIEYYPSWSEQLFNLSTVLPAPEIKAEADVFNIMFAGNIGDAQDFPAILAAAELLKEHNRIRWLIVGDGRLAQWVTDEINHRNLQEHVLMLGRHPVERMPSFFKHADALLVTLKNEPIFGMTIPGKLQAYLAAGIPVVAMLNGEGAAIVKQSNAGIICPAGNYQELASAVLTLSEMSPEEHNQMGRNGTMLSETEFNRDHLISKLEGWLETIRFNEVHTKKQIIKEV
ncbi:glycosyltransferase family 4 protein [Thiothrix lacustris]|uniref:glycosyltransferase family 4 protein n=1 Tax=Thiothrix lacustris TaxID=525917 RepID=UPI0027E41070|nr:glycosyltransferase family 4 protein [Thiothrix lacustris]WMP17960.1 glycosyltransferase family 4 protein [Thiothrix lacustris]